MNAPNLIENNTKKVNFSTINTIPHIILSAEGLKNPIHIMIDTGAELNSVKQKAVNINNMLSGVQMHFRGLTKVRITVVRLDVCQQHNLGILVNFYQYNIFFCVLKCRVLS